jgi:hypothetical protein
LAKSIQPSGKRLKKKMPRFTGAMKPVFAMIVIMVEVTLRVGKPLQYGYRPGVNGWIISKLVVEERVK